VEVRIKTVVIRLSELMSPKAGVPVQHTLRKSTRITEHLVVEDQEKETSGTQQLVFLEVTVFS
jgi:hypothetical protein